MMDRFLQSQLDLNFFHDNGFVRKKCSSCGEYFWTLNSDIDLCGDVPCVDLSFIGKPIGKKSSLRQVREGFLSFFEEHGHSRLFYPETGERCPVVARWRSDIYLTIASIADFQPHVTSGEVPPPANPLAISQPCIRLNDLEKVGRSGRHLTIFEMMGHHAFNKKENEVYWKEETVAYCDEFFRRIIGIPREMITYKEQLWEGGGNAGPCLEVLAGGLEVATLVFMNMKEDLNGGFLINGKRYAENPLNIVDTGYGLERITWISTGTSTIYDSIFPDVIKWLRENATSPSSSNDVIPDIYALADHSKCLAFMLGDGIVPSNVKAGYLARVIIRRSLRFIEKLKLQVSLKEIVDMQLSLLEKDFPSLKKHKTQIDEILDIETKKYIETLSRGENLVRRIIRERGTLDDKALISLYDTHGLPPDFTKKIAEKEGINISVPENFESRIAELHSHEKKMEKQIERKKIDLPDTELLYYKDHYAKEFDAIILWKNKTEEGTEIILDKTMFYPEGGGQPSDRGTLTVDGKKFFVKHVKKNDGLIIHLIDANYADIEVGGKIHGHIDWEYRYTLMKHHTGTHLLNGALRKILGEHIWQAGSQIRTEEARFDFSHYKTISDKEKKRIEELANQFIQQAIDVEKKLMDRNLAEKKYGFRLYQGGVPSGNKIRVINIPEVDVEACGGTHLNNTREVEKIRILKAERIQDGVNRIIFAAGKMADAHQDREEELYNRIIELLSPVYIIREKRDVSQQLKETADMFSIPISHLEKTIKRFLDETKEETDKTSATDLIEACKYLFVKWKKTQKKKKKVPSKEIKRLKKLAEKIPGTDIRLIIATSEYDSIATAGAITQENNYIVHIYDGNKITSSASGNVAIDLRKIAPEIGSVLGGSGGGKPRMTQSGGPYREKAIEALKKAEELTKKEIIKSKKK
ncbi:MAG: alanine--tRNA ligase [Thermoplasmata archaeon]|nr:MAG: alanine--tRNA ligase [Thermoplasmata archaeon]